MEHSRRCCCFVAIVVGVGSCTPDRSPASSQSSAPPDSPVPPAMVQSAPPPVASASASSSEVPPVQSMTGRPLQVALSDTFACAVIDNGEVWCWGMGSGGALGRGTKDTMSDRPTKVPGVTQAARVACGTRFACAALRNGSLQCWGETPPGIHLPTDATDGPATCTDVKDAVDLSAGLGELAVRRRDGKVMMWESDVTVAYYMGPGMKAFPGFCQGCTVPRLQNIVQVVSGLNTHCAIDNRGALACWGNSEAGQFGDGKVSKDKDPPARTARPVAAISNAVEIAVSGHVCARFADGKVSCWGDNSNGQVGDATSTQRLRPVPVTALAKVEQIAAGREHACARLAGGTLSCWGSNEHGQLGIGTADPHKTFPTAVTGISGVSSIWLGGYSSCAITQDGGLWCWGRAAELMGPAPKDQSNRPVRIEL